MMNSADLKKVWENNRQLREEVEGYYIESEMNYVEEILNEITPACRNWSIGFYSYNYLQVWDYKGFLEGCISATGDYGLLREEDKEKAQKILKKIDYLNYEMDYENKQYENLEAWIEKKTEEIKDKALEFLNAITEIDESYLFEYFEDFYYPEYIENDCDYYIVDNVLYEKQVKCYA